MNTSYITDFNKMVSETQVKHHFLKISELKEVVGYKSKAIYKWVKKNNIPYIKINSCVRYPLLFLAGFYYKGSVPEFKMPDYDTAVFLLSLSLNCYNNLLTVQEVADILQLSCDTVYGSLISKLSPLNINGSYKIRKKDFLEYLLNDIYFAFDQKVC